MKRLICAALALALLCAAGLAHAEAANALVVYFSRAGENYDVGVVEGGNKIGRAHV